MVFILEKGMGFCGLVCALCSAVDCPGCKVKFSDGELCSIGKCAIQKDTDGCYACPDCPCGEDMLQGKRNRAFNRYALEFGKQALLDRLRINDENGIIYHKPDGLAGDYDTPETEDEIYRLLRFGTDDPYRSCPTLESEHFILRLVSETDAEDLLVCYSDPKAWEIFNTDRCTSDFRYGTLAEMMECIRLWLDAYRDKFYIRFSVLNKATQKPVGTVEMFGSLIAKGRGGVLRIDVCSAYETKEFISELLRLADDHFFALFNVERIISKAIPTAIERIEALRSAGFAPFAWEPGRDHYFSKTTR